MRKALLISTLLFFGALVAQNTSKWSDLFSYNNVLAIREDGQRLIAATENGIFYYNPTSGEIKKISKANGLHEVKITAFDYNPETKIGLIGYKSGALDVITPQGIFLIVDIPIASGYSGDKKINHISISGNKAIISVGYGVSIFNLDKREFGDSSFFKTPTGYIEVLEAGFSENNILATTKNGLYYHAIDTTFPVFSTWITNSPGHFTNIAVDGMFAVSSTTKVFIGKGTSIENELPKTFTDIQDVVISKNNILVADENELSVFDKTSGALIKTIDFGKKLNTGIAFNDQYFSGSKFDGIINESKISLKPDGPYNNSSYKLSLFNNQIWVSSGGRDDYDTPFYKNLGYYHFDGNKWNYPDLFLKDYPKNDEQYNVFDVVPNPKDPTEVFFTNYSAYIQKKGIFKMKNNQLVKIYTQNDGKDGHNRPTGIGFDDNNNLFVTISTLDKPGEGNNVFVGYYLYNKNTDNFSTVTLNAANRSQKPLLRDNVIYIPAPRSDTSGLVMYNYGSNPGASNNPLKYLTKNNGLPSSDAISVAMDKNDNLWIGGHRGLRILNNPKAAFNETEPHVDPIIIEQNGLGEELFRDSEILQITVDSGNQKWISVAGGGVFYMSANGEQTYLHFTKANSPLPNDSVTDIQIDSRNGKVYFATIDGLMVYQGDVADVTENFGDILVYPNPVIYSQHKGNVRIKGLAAKTNIKITDAAGNVIHSAVARGGYYEWNLNNIRGSRVASGIYFVLMTNEDGSDTKTAKIAVVN